MRRISAPLSLGGIGRVAASRKCGRQNGIPDTDGPEEISNFPRWAGLTTRLWKRGGNLG
ncbi:hypothetical protein Rruber_05041 [Rhodococcus ruber]